MLKNVLGNMMDGNEKPYPISEVSRFSLFGTDKKKQWKITNIFGSYCRKSLVFAARLIETEQIGLSKSIESSCYRYEVSYLLGRMIEVREVIPGYFPV